jgi:hypothetical protein
MTTFHREQKLNIFRVCLDVDIEMMELDRVPIPNQTSFENGLQYGIYFLNEDKIAS